MEQKTTFPTTITKCCSSRWRRQSRKVRPTIIQVPLYLNAVDPPQPNEEISRFIKNPRRLSRSRSCYNRRSRSRSSIYSRHARQHSRSRQLAVILTGFHVLTLTDGVSAPEVISTTGTNINAKSTTILAQNIDIGTNETTDIVGSFYRGPRISRKMFRAESIVQTSSALTKQKHKVVRLLRAKTTIEKKRALLLKIKPRLRRARVFRMTKQ